MSGDERPEYANKLELMLTLVGYAVGLGNLWRFPYLVFTSGGGAFLIPYAFFLIVLGIPIFILEIGLGQMLRQGTMGIWSRLGVPKFGMIGVAATIASFFVCLYYCVILTWTVYYMGRTFGSMASGYLPWDDERPGYTCRPLTMWVDSAVDTPALFGESNLYNKDFQDHFFCDHSKIPADAAAAGTFVAAATTYTKKVVTPGFCPAAAAIQFWEEEALQQSSGMDAMGGLHWPMLLCHTIAWLIVYFIVFKGVGSSGKVVYVTATLPYVALTCFLVRALTLENMGTGLRFYLEPQFDKLWDISVWTKAATQIFYSLGPGFGTLIAFGSYGPKNSDFVKDSTTVAMINCGTSIFAGFVVFPILGFLASELSDVNPCIEHDDLRDLSKVGLQGTGLAFIAFPIAISQMKGSFAWALLFLVTLFCLGVDSQFSAVESVMTVLHDAGWGASISRERLAGIMCFVMYLGGIIFMFDGGIYWFDLFNNYSCVIALFFVVFMECVALTWMSPDAWRDFVAEARRSTGRDLGTPFWVALYKYICPAVCLVLLVLSFKKWDVMGAAESLPFEKNGVGEGYLPPWSVYAGWFLGVAPILGGLVYLLAGETRAIAAPAGEESKPLLEDA